MIALSGITKVYRNEGLQVPVLHDVSLNIGAGEFVAIMGPSGSGKSTLMNIIGCLDDYDAGTYHFNGQEVRQLTARAQATLRAHHIGFVFQSFNLVNRMSALRNVELPLVYIGVPARERRERALSALKRVGLEARSEHQPGQLSGGQQQRVAIARALVNRPEVIVADEPTGSLDSSTGNQIMQQLEMVNRNGTAIVLVTHEQSIATRASRTVYIDDGVIAQGWQPANPCTPGTPGTPHGD